MLRRVIVGLVASVAWIALAFYIVEVIDSGRASDTWMRAFHACRTSHPEPTGQVPQPAIHCIREAEAITGAQVRRGTAVKASILSALPITTALLAFLYARMRRSRGPTNAGGTTPAPLQTALL